VFTYDCIGEFLCKKAKFRRYKTLGNVHIILTTLGGQRFVTKPCKKVGICTVFVTKGEGGV
jgi:hypothetical protein